jgi:protein-S-isoprenylcysteine O-methyltransferase Ste14
VSALLVALQFGLIALIAWRVEPARMGAASGILLGAGLAVGAWALSANRPGNFNIRPEPREGGALVTHGPYRWVRHPMYLAVLLAMAALCVAGDAWQWALWGALLAVLAAKAAREEKGLAVAHPGYAGYRARTRAILPFVL